MKRLYTALLEALISVPRGVQHLGSMAFEIAQIRLHLSDFMCIYREQNK